jgi:hypothetical protein
MNALTTGATWQEHKTTSIFPGEKQPTLFDTSGTDESGQYLLALNGPD